MSHFILYTTEGYTQTPNGHDIENCQILGVERAVTPQEAIESFVDAHKELFSEEGYTRSHILVSKVANTGIYHQIDKPAYIEHETSTISDIL